MIYSSNQDDHGNWYLSLLIKGILHHLAKLLSDVTKVNAIIHIRCLILSFSSSYLPITMLVEINSKPQHLLKMLEFEYFSFSLLSLEMRTTHRLLRCQGVWWWSPTWQKVDELTSLWSTVIFIDGMANLLVFTKIHFFCGILTARYGMCMEKNPK